MRALSFMFSPVGHSDFANISLVVRFFITSIASAMVDAGILKADDPVLKSNSLIAILRAANFVMISKWRPIIIGGWNDGEGEGIINCMGGVGMAIFQANPRLVHGLLLLISAWAAIASIFLGVAWISCGLIIGTAHAAAAVTGDIARNMLGDLLPFLGTGGAVISGAIGQMAAIMSLICFACAGIASIYIIVVMTVEYTTNPEKANSHYAPWLVAIRIAVAVGLLAPLSQGYGGGQMIVGQLAAFGSDKASMAWLAAQQYLSDSTKWVSLPVVLTSDIVTAASGIIQDEICQAAWNTDPRGQPSVADKFVGSELDYDLLDTYFADANAESGVWGGTQIPKVCGSITYAAVSGILPSNGIIAPFYTAQQAAAEKFRAKVKAAVNPAAVTAWSLIGQAGPQVPPPSSLPGYITEYVADLNARVNSAWDASSGNLTSQIKDEGKGWVGAGQWLQRIVALQQTLAEAGQATPKLTLPLPIRDKNIDDVDIALEKWASVGSAKIVHQAPSNGSGNSGVSPNAAPSQWSSIAQSWRTTTGLWNNMVKLDGLDPIAQISSLGTDFMLAGTAIATGSGTAAFFGFSQIASMAGSLALAMIVLGCAMAYLIPALPMIRFLFAVVQWLILAMEAVLLVPIALLMMVSAESGGFFSPLARAGLINVTAVVLRPVLTIIGFIMSLAMLSTVLKMVNAIFLPWINNFVSTTSVSTLGPFGFLAFAAIYFIVVYVIVNTLTKLPETLPTAAARWLSASAGGENRDEGAGVVPGVSAAASRLVRR